MIRYSWNYLIRYMDMEVVEYNNQKPFIPEIDINRYVLFTLRFPKLKVHLYNLEEYLAENGIFDLFSAEKIYTKNISEDDIDLELNNTNLVASISTKELVGSIGLPMKVDIFIADIEDHYNAAEPQLYFKIRFERIPDRESTNQLLKPGDKLLNYPLESQIILPNGENAADYLKGLKLKLIKLWETQLGRELIQCKHEQIS